MAKSEEKVVWTRDETWSLINCLEEREILWNFTLKEYQNKVKKEAAFAEVANLIKTKSVGDIKKKLHALRSQHCGERMKIRKVKSGSGANCNYMPKWEFFNALNFMFKDAGSAGSVVDSMENTNTASDADEDTSAPSPNDVGSEDDMIFAVPEQPTKPHTSISKRKRQKEEDRHLQLAYSILEAPDPKEDSTTLFGKYVAEKLNQFDAYTKAILTQKINNLIFETEITAIERGIPIYSESPSPSPSPTSNSSPPSSSPVPQCSSKTTLAIENPVSERNEYLIIQDSMN